MVTSVAGEEGEGGEEGTWFSIETLLSLVPRLHSPAFYRTVYKSGVLPTHSAIKSWGVESGNEASSAHFE